MVIRADKGTITAGGGRDVEMGYDAPTEVALPLGDTMGFGFVESYLMLQFFLLTMIH